MKKAILDISPELMVDLFAGEGFARTYTVKHGALPDDARIVFCAWVDETGTGGRIRLLVESETFKNVPDGVEPPRLLPTLSTVTDAIRDAYERAAALAERIGDEEHEQSTDPQEDMSDRTGEKIAAAIRALKGEQ